MDAIASVESKTAKRALLVGVAHYDDQASCPNLRTPNADVEAMKRVPERPECGFTVTTLSDPIRTRFASAIEEKFSTAGRGDTVLLYFSGHGKAFDGLHLCTTQDSRQYSGFDHHRDFDNQEIYRSGQAPDYHSCSGLLLQRASNGDLQGW